MRLGFPTRSKARLARGLRRSPWPALLTQKDARRNDGSLVIALRLRQSSSRRNRGSKCFMPAGQHGRAFPCRSAPGSGLGRNASCDLRCASGSGGITTVRISGPRTRSGASDLRLLARAIVASSTAARHRTRHNQAASPERAQASTSEPPATINTTTFPIEGPGRRTRKRTRCNGGACPGAGELPPCLRTLRSSATGRAREAGAGTLRHSTLALSRSVLIRACRVCLARAWINWGLTWAIAGAVKGR